MKHFVAILDDGVLLSREVDWMRSTGDEQLLTNFALSAIVLSVIGYHLDVDARVLRQLNRSILSLCTVPVNL